MISTLNKKWNNWTNWDGNQTEELDNQDIDVQPQEDAESTGVRRSTRVKFQTRADYVPSMTGSKYALATMQLENHGVLHPGLHMSFFQHMVEQEPDTVAAIMTQMSLKAGLKAWGKQAHNAAYMEMKQQHFRDTFWPLHFKALSNEQKKRILRSHIFLKKRDVEKSKEEQLQMALYRGLLWRTQLVPQQFQLKLLC